MLPDRNKDSMGDWVRRFGFSSDPFSEKTSASFYYGGPYAVASLRLEQDVNYERLSQVSDESVDRWLWDEFRLAVEPAAATTVAVLATGAFSPPKGSKVLTVLSGGNVAPGDVERSLV